MYTLTCLESQKYPGSKYFRWQCQHHHASCCQLPRYQAPRHSQWLHLRRLASQSPRYPESRHSQLQRPHLRASGSQFPQCREPRHFQWPHRHLLALSFEFRKCLRPKRFQLLNLHQLLYVVRKMKSCVFKIETYSSLPLGQRAQSLALRKRPKNMSS